MAEAPRPTGRPGSRQPGSRPRRVVSEPTGAPAEPYDDTAQSWADEPARVPVAPPAGGPSSGSAGRPAGGSAADDRAWAAEAERLLADRPPHWG